MTEWRIHLGVHKTATTHLQQVLEALGPTLTSKGIGHVPTDILRASTGDILRPPGFRRRLMGARPISLGEMLGNLNDGEDRVILSEENWIGEAWEGCEAPPYKQMEHRLENLKDLPDGDRVHFFLSIRNPGEFATSVIAEALRHHPKKVAIERARASWLEESTPWCNLVSRLKARFPYAPLTIWPYEIYRDNAQALTEMLTGISIQSFPHISDPVATKRPAAGHVAKMAGSRWNRKGIRTTTKDSASDGDSTFTLFSEEECLTLNQSYEDDKIAIRKGFPGSLIEPESVADAY